MHYDAIKARLPQGALKTIELCAAQRHVQEPSVSAYLAQRQP